MAHVGPVIPKIPNISAKVNSVLEISKGNPSAFNLMPDEVLTVTVTQKQSAGRYVLALKDNILTATSESPLNVGEKLQVKVQSTHPHIILNVIESQKFNADAKVNERLLQWRVHPDSLTDILGRAAEFSAMLKSQDLPLAMSQKKMDAFIKLFSNIVFSPQTKANPLFVRDFVSQLGILLENDLGQMSLQSTKENVRIPPDNLKASLLNLSAAITEALCGASNLDAIVVDKLMSLSSFTSDALKTVEARQAVNVVYQQNESGLYLQIPLALGEVLRHADVFITPDDKNIKGPKKFSSCRVVIFLDLDYLGEIYIDASVREGRIRCVIKCENETVKHLVDASSEALKEALSAIGYGVEEIDCLKAADLEHKKTEFMEQQLFGSVDLINHFA